MVSISFAQNRMNNEKKSRKCFVTLVSSLPGGSCSPECAAPAAAAAKLRSHSYRPRRPIQHHYRDPGTGRGYCTAPAKQSKTSSVPKQKTGLY